MVNACKDPNAWACLVGFQNKASVAWAEPVSQGRIAGDEVREALGASLWTCRSLEGCGLLFGVR